jgi:hypothetical protein
LRVEVAVALGEKLTVVHGEVHVVKRVVSRALNELLRDHVAVVNEDGLDMYRDEETQIKVSIHRANAHKSTVHILEGGHRTVLYMELTGMVAIVHNRRVGGKPTRPRA